MANLFFVHTPFQLFVAQQIIEDNKLENCYLLYGDPYGSIKDVIDAQVIKKYWSSFYFMQHLSFWANASFAGFKNNIKKITVSFNYIDEIINCNSIDHLYFGDIHNGTYQLLAFYYKKNNIRISFFEEGSSHYLNIERLPSYKGNRCNELLTRIKRLFINIYYDFGFFKPRMGFAYSNYINFKSIDYRKLPIDNRYSILPIHNEYYDKLITCRILQSDIVTNIIQEELSFVDKNNCILFMTEDIYILINSTAAVAIYLQTIQEYFEDNYFGEHIIIKFHPFERCDVRQKIIDIFNKLDIKFSILSNRLNIPVEYYLQQVNFKKVIMFSSSTKIYNGYLFDTTQFISLTPRYLNYCIDKGITCISEVEKFNNQLEELLKSVE